MRTVCQVLQIKEQSYYYRRKHPKKERYTQEELDNVYRVYKENHSCFGRRMIKKYLEREGIKYSEKKISNIMKILNLKARYGRRKTENVYTNKETKEKYVAKNIYNNLEKEEQEKIEAWSIDFTEQIVEGRKIYTCAIINIRTKVIVGYKQSYKIDAKLAAETLEKALEEYGTPNMILSDRGSQFTSKLYQKTLEEYGIMCSMSRPYKPVDNVYIETFFKTMKTEIGYVKKYTIKEYKMVVEYWMNYYNTKRIHSSIGYLTPFEYMYDREMSLSL